MQEVRSLLTFQLSDGLCYAFDLLGEFINLSLWHTASPIHNIDTQTLNISLKQPTQWTCVHVHMSEWVSVYILYECNRLATKD